MWFQRFNSKGGETTTARQRLNVNLLVSGGFIAIGFVAMVAPLAMFHAAQVAASQRVRSGLQLLFVVVLLVLGLGFVGGSPLLLAGGFNGMVWFPLFAFALTQRARLGWLGWSAAALCLPAFILPLTAFLIPAELPEVFLNAIQQGQANEVFSGVEEQQVRGLVTLLQEQNPLALKTLGDFLSLSPWQRLVWLVFGDGVGLAFAAVAMGLANLVFLDMAFEQVERLNAVASHVLKSPERFPRGLVEAVTASGWGRTDTRPLVFSVVGSSREDTTVEGWRNLLLRPKHLVQRVDIWGVQFSLGLVRPAWQLRTLRVPPLVAGISLGLMCLIVGVFGEGKQVIDAAAAAHLGPWLGIAGFVGFFGLALTALQGAMVIVQRSRPAALLFGFLTVLIVGSLFPLSPFIVLGGLGILAILDYRYDFRGLVSRSLVVA